MDDVIIYCRGSGNERDSAESLKRQEDVCRSHALSASANILDIFRDDGSANASDRPGLAAMFAFLTSRAGKPTVVLVEGPHILSRSIEKHFEVRSAIEKLGAHVEIPGTDDAGEPPRFELRVATER